MFKIKIETSELKGRSYLSYIYCIGCGNEIRLLESECEKQELKINIACSQCRTIYKFERKI